MPAALQVGYIDSYDVGGSNSTEINRKMVIVVVYDDWTVSCYDNTLKLLWEKQVGAHTHELATMSKQFKIDEVTILVSPSSIHTENKGLIVVGASMTKRSTNNKDVKDGPDARIEAGLDMLESGMEEHPEMRNKMALEHFSVYAMDGHTGHVIWKHDGRDEELYRGNKVWEKKGSDGQLLAMSVPQHTYMMDRKDLVFKAHQQSFDATAASIQSDWTVFKQSLMAELPHEWHLREDTAVRIAHFVRRHVGSSVRRKDKRQSSKGKSLEFSARKRLGDNPSKESRKLATSDSSNKARSSKTNIELARISVGETLTHNSPEHVINPNVLVFHTKSGVEVLSLASGSPVTSISLVEGQTYGDVNGDGLVDTVLVLENENSVAMAASNNIAGFSHDSGELLPCTLMVTSGLPARSQLFNISVCMESSQDIHAPISKLSKVHSAGKVKKRGKDAALEPISAASPLFLHKLDVKTKEEAKDVDIVVAINTGVVTRVNGGTGVLEWRVQGSPAWSPHTFPHTSVKHFDSDAGRVGELGTHDTVYSSLLVVGEYSMALLSRESGSILSSVNLPKSPVSRPIIGDFDNDGFTDVIIITNESILGYRLHVTETMRSLLIVVLVLFVIAIVAFLSQIQTEIVLLPSSGSGSASTSSSSSARTTSNSTSRRLFSIKRSTDDYHID